MSNTKLEDQINSLTDRVKFHIKFKNDLNEKIVTDKDFIDEMEEQGKNQMQLIYDSEAEDFTFVNNPTGNGQISIQPYDLANGVDNCNKFLDKEINGLEQAIKGLKNNLKN